MESDDDLIQEILSSDSDTEIETIIESRKEAKRIKKEQKELIANKKGKPKFAVDSEEDGEIKEKLPDLPDVSKFDRVWVLPFFAKPGHHSYLIKQKDTDEDF